MFSEFFLIFYFETVLNLTKTDKVGTKNSFKTQHAESPSEFGQLWIYESICEVVSTREAYYRLKAFIGGWQGSKFQTPRRKAGIQHEPYPGTKSLGTVNLSYQFKWWEHSKTQQNPRFQMPTKANFANRAF